MLGAFLCCVDRFVLYCATADCTSTPEMVYFFVLCVCVCSVCGPYFSVYHHLYLTLFPARWTGRTSGVTDYIQL